MGDVAVEQLAVHRKIEGGPHDYVDLVHGLGCEPGPVTAGGGREPLVEAVEMIGPEPSQRHVADRGVDVALHEPRVPVGGRRSHVAALERQPRVGEELAERDRATPGWGGANTVAGDASGDRLGLLAMPRA